MANFLKKLISGISVAAILTATAVCPVMAEEVYESWDYSTGDAVADWTLGDNTTQSIVDGMLKIENGSTSGTRTSSKSLTNTVTEGDFVVEYAMKSRSYGDNASTITIGESATNYIVELKFPKHGNTVIINGESVTLTGAAERVTPLITVKHSILTGSDLVKTEITDGTNTVSFTTSYAVNNASDSVKMMIANIAKYNSIYVQYFTVSEYIPTDEEQLSAAMGKFILTEGQLGMTDEGDYYSLKNDIALPGVPDGVDLSWELLQRPIDDEGAEWTATDYASVTNGKLIISPTEVSGDYLVKATATITCGDATDSVLYMFCILAPDPNAPTVYYSENFEGFSAGTLVDFNSSSNTDYSASNGMTFSCGTRDGDNGVTGASIVSSGGQYLNLFQTKHTGQSRQPVVTLSRTSGIEFEKNLVIKFKANFAATTTILKIADSSGNTLEISAPNEAYVGAWLDFELCQQAGKTVVVVRNEDGELIELYTDKITLSDVKMFSTPDITYSFLYIDDLYIADEVYAVSNETIVSAAKTALEFQAQSNLSEADGVLMATGDFYLPETPELSTVVWSAEEKAVDSGEWVASSLMSISGSKVVINPTDEIDNYETRLVATVTSGDVSDTKTFVINLPNPLDEIAGVIASGYEVVESTDYTDSTNTTKLTYDLNADEVLKYDLVLPATVKGYKNCIITWTSSDTDHVSISGTTASIMTDDLEEHDVTLTAVVTYKKGDITYSSDPQNFEIKVGYTDEDAADTETYYKGKYKVRFDAACDDNFEDIPDETTSDIDLPTEGKFGSKISWSSSAPSVIKTNGKVTRQSSDKTVKLTASITSGAGSAEKTFEVEVPKKSSSSGGGGGGSTSSTGTISSIGGTGTIASNPTSTVIEESSAEQIISQLQEEAAAANDLFTDLGKAAWAREAINGLAAAGIVNGKSDTEFAPNDTVTRAEFAKMLMGVFGLDSGAYRTSSFGDVSTDAWYFNSVETAYNLGIINGIGNGQFAPNALITRQDMAVMVVRAANVCGVSLPEVEEGITFADNASISDYAKTPVSTLQKANVINGVLDTTFAPLDNATRAQAAQILYNVLSIAG